MREARILAGSGRSQTLVALSMLHQLHGAMTEIKHVLCCVVFVPVCLFFFYKKEKNNLYCNILVM